MTESIPKVQATRTRTEINEEYKIFSTLAGDRAFKKALLEAEIEPKKKQIENLQKEVEDYQLKMATLFTESALEPTEPQNTVFMETTNQLGKSKKKKTTEAHCTA